MRRSLLRAWSTLLAVGATWRTDPRAATFGTGNSIKWMVFYGPTADEQLLASYDIVILDSMFQGSIPAVSRSGARVCGYLSLGEIRTSDAFYHRLTPDALLEPNPAWPDARRIDVRQPAWQQLVLHEIIPSISAKGFAGLLLDTLDTPPYLEQQDPAGKRGMRQAAVDLVQSIHRTYPHLLLIMNRGYALLPSVIECIDAIVAESLLTHPDQQGGYAWNDDTEVKLQLSLLTPAAEHQPRLPVLSLDYWNPDDIDTITRIYARERQLGHSPYVATRMLDRIVPAPPLLDRH
jgi:uncharacterized protein (TIGR01370 family)